MEDGGRAIVIDEAVVAYVWEYARRHQFLEGVTTVDYRVLKTIKQLTGGLEVRVRSATSGRKRSWPATPCGVRSMSAAEGVIEVDLEERRIELVG